MKLEPGTPSSPLTAAENIPTGALKDISSAEIPHPSLDGVILR